MVERLTFDVFDGDGNMIGAVPISPMQYDHLKKGAEIEIRFHTPRMLREILAVRNGVFKVKETGGLFVVDDAEQAKEYLKLQAEIDA